MDGWGDIWIDRCTDRKIDRMINEDSSKVDDSFQLSVQLGLWVKSSAAVRTN